MVRTINLKLRYWQKNITPASAAAVRGANFATAKFRDAYGSPLEAIVGRSRYRVRKSIYV
jgi:hypothetical protein